MKTSKFNIVQLVLLAGFLLPLIATAGIPITSKNVGGSWYNPSQSGHGFVLEVLQNKQLNVYWYAYDLLGNQRWFLGIGDIDGDQATVSLYTTQGGIFGPGFDPGDVERILDWGILSFEFDSCNSGTVTYDVEYGSDVLEIQKLTAPDGLVCQNDSSSEDSFPDPEDFPGEVPSVPDQENVSVEVPSVSNTDSVIDTGQEQPDTGRDASGENPATPDAENTPCVNIAGEWNISENVTMNCTISEKTTSQSLNVAGKSIIQQNGCSISYEVPGYELTRNGTVDGNDIQISNAYLLPEGGDVVVTDNTFSAEGTISDDSINLEGSGSTTGTIDGESVSCKGKGTVTLYPA
jgi:hypothetical protein